MDEVITVTALNRYVKTMLDADDVLFDLALRGEVANFVCNARSGHCYFSLRDERSSVKAVMFKADAGRLAFRPQEGMRVVVRCRVTLYERDGAFQVYVSDMFPEGVGSAQLALEQLKERLAAEGIFAPEHKRPIPACPGWIGVVTSKTGAALQDIRNVLARRWPLAKVLLCPVQVQGEQAAAQVAAAIDTLDTDGRPEVILVARGGGSREDLWVFNDECIVRAAYRCKTPLISAIGHEIDTTLLDYVADLRAPTPSAAAELAVPDRAVLRQEICTKMGNIHEIMQMRWESCYNRGTILAEQLAQQPCTALAAGRQAELARLAGLCKRAAAAKAARSRQRMAQAAALAASLDPYATVARGYALLGDDRGHVTTVDQLRPGQHIRVENNTHTACCLVEAVKEKNDHENTQKL